MRAGLLAAQRGAIAGFTGLFVCCCGTALSAGTIECLTAPNRSEPGWWSWREIDGRKCWYKKVGAMPPKSDFFWAAPATAIPAEESTKQEPLPLQQNDPITDPLPLVEIARVKPLDSPTVDFRSSEGMVDLLIGFSLRSFHGLGGTWQPLYDFDPADTFDARYGRW
jgi:hypothetical protein